MGIEEITRSIDQGNFDLANQAIKDLSISQDILANIFRADVIAHKQDVSLAPNIIENAVNRSRTEGDWFLELGALTMKSLILFKLGNIEESQETAEAAEFIIPLLSTNGSKLNSVIMSRWEAILNYVNCLLAYNAHEFDVALGFGKEAVDVFENLGMNYYERKIKLVLAKILTEMSKYNSALSYYYELNLKLQGTHSSDDFEKFEDLLQSLQGIAEIHFSRGQYHLALHYFKILQDMYKESGDNRSLAKTHQFIGKIYIHRGHFDEAFDQFQKSVLLLSSKDDKREQGYSNLQIASVNFMMGNLDRALSIYEQCLSIFNSIDDQFLIAWSFMAIGEIYRVKGDYETALDYFKSNLHLLEQLNHHSGKAESLNKIGVIYQHQGKLNWALDYFQRSLSIYIKVGDKISSVDTLFNLIQIKLEMRSINQAKYFLKLLSEIAEKSQDKSIIQKHRIAQALIYKHDKRLTEKIKGQLIFQEIAKEEIISHELTVLAMLNLCDMLIMELYLYQEDEVLEEVKYLSSELYEIAQEQKSFKLLVEVLMLQAKFALIDGNANRALRLLDQAQITIEDKNLKALNAKFEIQLSDIRTKLSEWEDLNARNATLRKRMELADVDGYIEKLFS